MFCEYSSCWFFISLRTWCASHPYLSANKRYFLNEKARFEVSSWEGQHYPNPNTVISKDQTKSKVKASLYPIWTLKRFLSWNYKPSHSKSIFVGKMFPTWFWMKLARLQKFFGDCCFDCEAVHQFTLHKKKKQAAICNRKTLYFISKKRIR